MTSSASSPLSPATSPPVPPPTGPCPDSDPATLPPPASLVGDVAAPVPTSAGRPEVLLPPPSAELTPVSSPTVVTGAPLEPAERAWEEVGGRRRSRLVKSPAPPPRKETGPSPAFRRRTFGLCFRCLAADHFVAECHGSIRCLRCRLPGHRERDCEARRPDAHGRSPPAPPCRSSDMPDGHAAPPCGGSPPDGHRSWASVVAHTGATAAVPSEPGADLQLLQSLLAAKAEAVSVELQAMFAARLEEVFQPLRDLVAAVQGWTDQVSTLWELMEALGGNLALANSSEPDEHGEVAQDVAGIMDSGVAKEAGCSSEMCAVMVQSTDDPPDLVFVLPEKVRQDVEEQAKEIPSDHKSLKVSEDDAPLGGSGVPLRPTSSSLLDGYLSSFSSTASLLDAPILVQFEEDSACTGRRSGRLDKKNKHCSIPIAKRAEYRLAESFGELPKDSIPKKGSEEDVQEKMKPLLRLCKKPASPMATQAIRELVLANV